jgi:hypothetical protein
LLQKVNKHPAQIEVGKANPDEKTQMPVKCRPSYLKLKAAFDAGNRVRIF